MDVKFLYTLVKNLDANGYNKVAMLMKYLEINIGLLLVIVLDKYGKF